MFNLLRRLFKPPSEQNIKNKTNKRLHNARRTMELRTTKANNGGRTNLTNIKLNAERINNRGLDGLLKKNDLSTNARPSYRVNQNKNGKSVTFTVPFSTLNKFTTARVYLNSIKNRGNFKNIKIVNVRKSDNNNSTLTFTLSSSRNMTVPLPQYFVQKMLGVDVPLDQKGKITKEDVINWSKYRKVKEKVKEIKYVKDLIKVDELFEGKLQQKIYGLWDTYGKHIAKRVEDMRLVMDPKNITKILGKNPEQEDALELVLKSTMMKYLQLEQGVYTKKETLNVKSLYKKYTIDNKTLLFDSGRFLPKFCNIPLDWRVHLVHHTMTESDTNEVGNQRRGDGGTWNDFEAALQGGTLGVFNKRVNIPAKIQRVNYMNKAQHDIDEVNDEYNYTFLLRNYRPFLRQSFHTIGSIRYPHSRTASCPLTKRDDVWEYEFKRKSTINTGIDGDTWIEILSEREGFVKDLEIAHVEVNKRLNDLVEYYKLKVLTERARRKANTNSKQKKVDIDLAWELYSICYKCKMYDHPMFRVCAGFRSLNASSPENSQFMDRFRYMVHNRPRINARSEPESSHVEFVLTQSDVKYFFLSSGIYSSSKYMIKEIKNNNKSYAGAFNAQNKTRNSSGSPSSSLVPQVECAQLISENLVGLLEPPTAAQNGNSFLAWPTLHEASEYYK